MKTDTARLYSAKRPSDAQMARFKRFVAQKYGEGMTLEWIESDDAPGGFRLEAGSDVYDWSAEGRVAQLRRKLERIALGGEKVIPLIKETLDAWQPEALAEETGRVISVGDGIVAAEGLDNAEYGEIVLFDCGAKGMIQDLRRDMCGIIVFGDCREISSGSVIRRTRRTAGVPAGNGFLGRIVDALGEPVDGLGEIVPEAYRPIECPAPGIIDRKPVDKPLETGLLVIDALFPIGRGQRELIIGDRQTGKTAIALDTIINQKGKGVVCVYVAIGQKASSVAQLAETLRKKGAMDYTVIVTAGAGESAPRQYVAPYSGCAIAEYFMYTGRDVLIVYDDLSKHAVAYRQLSLLLERAPGREAYPGDVFYLHSRLLERAAHLSDALGGGSMTALPVVETQAGDVAAYIPTNVISITDGQIFLESELFFEGQRPAVNIGLSVSRVGGNAQTRAVKKAVGSLRLDLAQFREMEVFMQFSSDLDETTRRRLMYGQGLMRLLRQPQYKPYSQSDEVILLVSALGRAFEGVPAAAIYDRAAGLLEFMRGEHPEIASEIDRTGELTPGLSRKILAAAKEYGASKA
ncbi:MAG TPA: F0F1 ATP synthase subunit alpha [Candidatus Limadaptatus stercoripullorum]|uniref:ATP synthase subunit alpha n=1 Tax=Candidatus Limadaptatus stercoripullorum TaxID=2840846 RepID=A0A9D1N920_9FIRM|nr:F0F1 ATP synthase subunit alpha [Candidatus Limadaptatus stercoripullorum]